MLFGAFATAADGGRRGELRRVRAGERVTIPSTVGARWTMVEMHLHMRTPGLAHAHAPVLHMRTPFCR